MSILNIEQRDNSLSNSAKKARKSGKIPGVIYGKKMRSFMFEVGDLELAKEVSQKGEHGIIDYEVNGEEHKGLLKSVQRDPVTHKIIHIDLEELKGNENIVSNVPINYIGEEYLNQKGIVLQKEKNSVKVECNPTSLPKVINFDIGSGSVGDVFRLADLEVASEISVLDDLSSVVASISYERKKVSEDMKLVEEINEEKE